MDLYLTRNAAIENEIRQPLAAGIEDLLADGGTVEDYYDISAIADETIGLFVSLGRPVCYVLRPDIYPSLFQDICEQHARPAE